MKLLKTGSEDSYVYVIADDIYSQNKSSKIKSTIPSEDKPMLSLQQNSFGM